MPAPDPDRLTLWLQSLGVGSQVMSELRQLLADSDVPLPERYEDRGLLGRGGMGEVRRVYDTVLGREVAMKRLRPERLLAGGPDGFRQEARAIAGLQHPGVIPVYDYGMTDDERPFFTMELVRGETLRAGIGAVHAGDGDPRVGLRRLVDVLRRVADAVGFAHSKGVLHLDLKPANVMVADRGEVRVVDWGLFRASSEPQGAGIVAGTPATMAPEQARGDTTLDERADVYALGCMLWEILEGRPPRSDHTTDQILSELRQGIVPPAPRGALRPAPELTELVVACTQPDPSERPRDARVVAERLGGWLDGVARQERARAALEEADAHARRLGALRARAHAARERADVLVAETRSWEPDTSREAWWAADDAAQELERSLRAADRAIDQALERALAQDPDSPEAHAMAAERARVRQAAAEQCGDDDAAAAAEHRLRQHLQALPAQHPVRASASAWLRGDGTLTLHTDPPGARVVLHRYELQRRRLVPVEVEELGHTPLEAHPVPHGRWLVSLHAPGRAVVRYPIEVGRQEHWDGAPPGAARPGILALPAADALSEGERYVPAGWARIGGDPEAPQGLPARRVWIDGFVMRTTVVTNGEYLAFLDDLVARGAVAEAERYAPRNRGTTRHAWGDILYHRDGDRFVLPVDADGDRWESDWPVIMIDHVASWAYARWEAERTGLPWRLPGELEWEKAARGVDGRIYPWGDHIDPSWCSNRRAFAGEPRVESVHARPTDVSVYGVCGMAGGVVEWTADRMTRDGPPGERCVVPDGSQDTEAAWLDRTADHSIVGRGGSRVHDLNAARCAFRLACDPWGLATNVGFRLVRPWPG